MIKKYIHIVLFVFGVCLISTNSNAQTYSDLGDNGTQRVPQAFSAATILSNQVNQINTNSRSKANNVFVAQIGSYNEVYTNTRSLRSEINLYQQGNRNVITQDMSAFLIRENVIQRGLNNSFTNIGVTRSLFNRTNVVQKGQNQNLLMIGSNSISERMTIVMKGQNQTILIRNIKPKQ